MFDRLRIFFRSLIPSCAWDTRGRLKYLLVREAEPAACAVAGVSPQATERALRLFCDAFDIPDEQVFCLRPADLIHDLYRAMVSVTHDDMEYERLAMNLEEAIGRALSEDEFDRLVTIENVIQLVHEKAMA